MARSPIAVFNGHLPGIEGLEDLQRRIAALPDAIIDEVKPALEKGADQLVAKIKSIAPVDDDMQSRPGELRDSVHKEPGRHELSVMVVEDARDEGGHMYPAHVEHGHKAADGSHVEPKPHFWPAYNLVKKPIKARLNRAMNAGIKKAFSK